MVGPPFLLPCNGFAVSPGVLARLPVRATTRGSVNPCVWSGWLSRRAALGPAGHLMAESSRIYHQTPWLPSGRAKPVRLATPHYRPGDQPDYRRLSSARRQLSALARGRQVDDQRKQPPAEGQTTPPSPPAGTDNRALGPTTTADLLRLRPGGRPRVRSTRPTTGSGAGSCRDASQQPAHLPDPKRRNRPPSLGHEPKAWGPFCVFDARLISQAGD